MIEFSVDKKGEHRWRAVAKNGRIVADCGEGYKRKCDAVKGLESTVSVIEDWLISYYDTKNEAKSNKKGK